MSATKQLKALARDRVGKGAARAVRREGRVPAVIYGGGESPVSISLDYNETKKLIFAGHFKTTLFEIDVDGTKTRAIPRDYQLDPVKDLPVHIDFLRVKRGEQIKVDVPIHVTDQEKSPGIKEGGTVQIVEHSLELMVEPDKIPDAINISVAKLAIGDTVHLEDIKLPGGATALKTDNPTLVSIVAPMVLEEETSEGEAAAGEGEAKAE